MNKVRCRWAGFLILLSLLSAMVNLYAAEYVMRPYEIVKSMWVGNSDLLKIDNKTTRTEVMKDYELLTDAFDGIASGYTPTVKMSAGFNQDQTETVFWRVKLTQGNTTELETDTRIVEELEQIKARTTKREKIEEIDRFVKSVCEYDKEYQEGSCKASETALGALNGKAICQGYANLTSFLYDQAGIKNVKVRGVSTKSGVRHVWNVVEMDGCYYVVDTTWNEAREDYLLISPEEYSQYASTEQDVDKLFYLKYNARREHYYTLRTLLKYI